jgi:hypothetical protein
LFLARDGAGRVQPKLLDFGVARWMFSNERITSSGIICGTPCYMSPEQARGSRDVDPRSDIFSLCATLYELVTSRAPFDGDNYNAVIFSVINKEPTPVHCFGADLEFASIIQRGMRKPVEGRYQSARELAHALSSWLLDRGIESDACGHSLCARLSASMALPKPEEDDELRADAGSELKLEEWQHLPLPAPANGFSATLLGPEATLAVTMHPSVTEGRGVHKRRNLPLFAFGMGVVTICAVIVASHSMISAMGARSYVGSRAETETSKLGLPTENAAAQTESQLAPAMDAARAQVTSPAPPNVVPVVEPKPPALSSKGPNARKAPNAHSAAQRAPGPSAAKLPAPMKIATSAAPQPGDPPAASAAGAAASAQPQSERSATSSSNNALGFDFGL